MVANQRKFVCRAGREEGFTLIEVMVATVIAGVGVMAGYGMVEWADHGRVYGAQGTRALSLATSELERVRAEPWDTLLRGPRVTEEDVDEIHMVRSLEPSNPHQPMRSGHVYIHVSADYRSIGQVQRSIDIGTVRANPVFVGHE
ncbi:MAG: prepilin-type N-terminal cleavage/methylation domain-containing protein [Nitrospiraceae bacterium]